MNVHKAKYEVLLTVYGYTYVVFEKQLLIKS